MRNVQEWNVDDVVQIELVFNGYNPDPNVVGRFYRDIFNLSQDKAVPADLADVLDKALLREHLCGDETFHDEPADLFIKFNSQGYYDPGCVSGPIDRCYPPEGGDDRTMIEVRFEFGDEPVPITLTREEQTAIFDHFQDVVDEREIEDNYEYPY